MAARILLTGFEPFGPHDVNPSERVLRPLAAAAPGGAIVSTRVLPVSYRAAFSAVREALDSERLDAVLLLGLGAGGVFVAGGTSESLGGPVQGPGDAWLARERAGAAMGKLRGCARRLLAQSDDAGTFLCNQVLYQTLRHCDRHALRVRAGFVHLPLLPEQAAADEPALDEDVLVAGLSAAVAALAALPPPEAADAGEQGT